MFDRNFLHLLPLFGFRANEELLFALMMFSFFRVFFGDLDYLADVSVPCYL